MSQTGEPDQDGLVKIGTFASKTAFSRTFVASQFDAGVLPGLRAGAERRISRRFMDALFAEIFSGRTVVLEEFAERWKSAQAQGRAA